MVIRIFPKELISTEKPEKAEPRWNPDKKNTCSRKILTPENFNVFRGLNGGHDKDRTCDPYDVNGEFFRENGGKLRLLMTAFCRFLYSITESLTGFCSIWHKNFLG